MQQRSWILGALALGAGLVYMLDPKQGTRRRRRVVHGLGAWSNRARRLVAREAQDIDPGVGGAATEVPYRLAAPSRRLLMGTLGSAALAYGVYQMSRRMRSGAQAADAPAAPVAGELTAS